MVCVNPFIAHDIPRFIASSLGGRERGVPVTGHRKYNTDFTNHLENKTIIMDHVENKETMY